jgi:hypothetical protein
LNRRKFSGAALAKRFVRLEDGLRLVLFRLGRRLDGRAAAE